MGKVIAPGCTDADGVRALQGLCGLWSVGVNDEGEGVAGEPGMSGMAAPGAYTPTKTSTIRFLDGGWTVGAPLVLRTVTVDVNRHLQEAGRLAGEDLPGAHQALPGSNYVWAWYGEWTDRNGNGVVDHVTPGSAGPTVNEFAWLGGCIDFNGVRNGGNILKGLCIEDPNPNIDPPGQACTDEEQAPCAGTTIHGWFFPGNHHGSDATSPDDLPGNQVITFALLLGDCQGPPSCDDLAREQSGDPLLDRQGEVDADHHRFQDRTADPGDTVRQWAGWNGWSTYFYGDDGLLVTMVEVWGVNCRATVEATRYDLASCTFTDVDRQGTVVPAAEELLVGGPGDYPDGGLKHVARSSWLLLRGCDCTDSMNRLVDSVANSRDVYELTQGPARGALDDLALESGWGREPNTPEDRFVGAEYKPCGEFPVGDARNPTEDLDPEELESQHRGYCNTGPDGAWGQAYDAHRIADRGYLDVQLERNVAFAVPIQLFPGLSCFFCIYSPLLNFDDLGVEDPEPPGVPPAAEDHRRTLGPGNYYLHGVMGTWRDRAHTFDESLFPDPPGTTLATYPADGWLGVVQRSTGQWRYRNYLPVECTTEKDAPPQGSMHEAAECNPYLDGHVEDPQEHLRVPQGGEVGGSCSASDPYVRLRPADGAMDSQVLVWREHGSGLHPDLLDFDGDGQTWILPKLEAYGPGPVTPLHLRAYCRTNEIQGADYLIWPEGNRGDDIVTRMAQAVPLGVDLDGDGLLDWDLITDVDHYADWEPL